MTAPTAPAPAGRADFIAAMRRVAASVSVVTTDGPAGRQGATVSAFASVSADPPTVLVCLRAESRIARAVTQNGCFAVNVLPLNCMGIANRFAGMEDTTHPDRFAGIPCFGPEGAPPAIEGATVFTCTIDQMVNAGSHVVAFGIVNSVVDSNIEPLAYLDGAYHRVTGHEGEDG